MLYDFLRETYGENKPIFVADIQYKRINKFYPTAGEENDRCRIAEEIRYRYLFYS